MRFPIVFVTLLAFALPAAPLLAQTPSKTGSTSGTTATQLLDARPAISVVTASDRHLEAHVVATGLVQAVQTVDVAPLIEGQQIEALLANVGDRVKKGQVLARLSKATLALQKSQLAASEAAAKASIAQAEATLIEVKATAQQARRTAERTAKLMASGNATSAANDNAQSALVSAQARVAVATQTLAAAKAQLDLVKAQIANVDLQLSRTDVTAPVSGTVTARNATLGAIASAAGAPMFTIIRGGALELRAGIDESDIARLARGQTAVITLASNGRQLTGKVSLVEPTINTTTRLGYARITFDDMSTVRVGMFAQASILVAKTDALALPLTAVSTDNGRQWVMVVRNDTVFKTAVTTGINDGQWVEITSGISSGTEVVAKAAAFVRTGDRIDPVPLATN